MRLAGELNKKPTNGATLDELLVRVKTQLTKLGPILDLEILREPEGTDGGRAIEHGRRPGACARHRVSSLFALAAGAVFAGGCTGRTIGLGAWVGRAGPLARLPPTNGPWVAPADAAGAVWRRTSSPIAPHSPRATRVRPLAKICCLLRCGFLG